MNSQDSQPTHSDGTPQTVATPVVLLPFWLHRQVAGRDVDGEGDAVQAFVNEGVIPVDPFHGLEVASWCLQQDLPEHFKQLRASYVLVSAPARLETVADCLADAPGVQILAFERCTIDDGAANRLAASLKGLAALADLRFDACTMSPEALEILVSAPKGLRLFEIDGVAIGTAMPALAGALRNNPIEDLVLTRASLGNGQLRTLCASLAHIQSLKSLVLLDNDFDDGTALAETVSGHPSLTSLVLGKCPPQATAALLRVLRENECGLRRLAMNRIDANWVGLQKWFDDVAAMLKTNRTLHELDINDNSLALHSLQQLGDALRRNGSLCELQLGPSGSFSDTNIDGFIDMLDGNASLTALHLNHWLNHSQHHAIDTLVRRNQNRALETGPDAQAPADSDAPP